MGGYILVIAVLTNGVSVPTVYPNTFFETKEECENAASHSAVIETYKDIFGKDLRMWCEPVKRSQGDN